MEESGVEAREMGVGDLGAAQEVARITRAETYRCIIPEDELTGFVERAYSEESLKHRMETGRFLVAVLGGEVVGVRGLRPGARQVWGGGAAGMRGVGTRLLEARRFYEARGFRSVGEHVWRTAAGEVSELEMVLEIGRKRG
jgi:hypothetical protein